jgi:hypothetical protein
MTGLDTALPDPAVAVRDQMGPRDPVGTAGPGRMSHLT